MMAALFVAVVLIVLFSLICLWEWATDPAADELSGDLQRPVDALQSDVSGRPREPMLAESVEKSAASKDPLLWRDQVRSDVQARLRAMQGGKR